MRAPQGQAPPVALLLEDARPCSALDIEPVLGRRDDRVRHDRDSSRGDGRLRPDPRRRSRVEQAPIDTDELEAHRLALHQLVEVEGERVTAVGVREYAGGRLELVLRFRLCMGAGLDLPNRRRTRCPGAGLDVSARRLRVLRELARESLVDSES